MGETARSNENREILQVEINSQWENARSWNLIQAQNQHLVPVGGKYSDYVHASVDSEKRLKIMKDGQMSAQNMAH